MWRNMTNPLLKRPPNMKINASAGMTKPHGTPRIQKVEEVGAKV
jgi:hypothetical protein